jgi:plastocyanin/sugar lactone lactonase YvrE
MRSRSRQVLARLVAAIAVALSGLPLTATMVAAQDETLVEIFATGLVNPKGMAFGPTGTLYVAESGAPGDVMVPLPVNFGGEGPMGSNGRVSRITSGGEREDVITGLPNIGLYGGVEMLGAAAVAVDGDTFYEVSAGHMTFSPLLSSFTEDGTLSTVADLGAYNDEHPPPASNGDAVPMGNPYDLVPLGGNLYVTDGNYNRVLRVAPSSGEISILAAWENSPVTVGAAAGPDGALYVAQFSPAPYLAGSGRIDRITTDGAVTEGVVTNLTTPIDVAFAPDGTMYVLQYAAEFSEEKLRYIAFGGQVQRVNPDGSVTPIVTNLVFPTHMIFGPDGALYVTNYGNESNQGQGQVLRVVPGETAVAAPEVPPPDESGQYTTGQPTPEVDPNAQPVATINIIEVGDSMQWGYDPAELTIQVGQTVIFTNTGRITHTATSTSGDFKFDTGYLKAGQSATVTFDRPGTFDYYCQPHPWMKAVIIVEGTGPAGENGEVANFEEPNPPSISPWRAIAFVGLIIAAVFAAGFAMRRSPRESPPSPAEEGDD